LDAEPNSWEAHVTLAVIYVCCQKWTLAETHITRGLTAGGLEARTHVLYCIYLVATDKPDEARRVTRLKVAAAPDDCIARITLGLFSYVVRDYETARRVIEEAINLKPRSWAALAIAALVDLACGETFGATQRLEKLHVLYDVVEHRSACHMCFHGLLALCLTQLERQPSRMATGYLKQQMENPGMRAAELQLVFAYMALGEYNAAIVVLTCLSDAKHPLMMWLPKWPFFDSLRDRETSQPLMHRWNESRAYCEDQSSWERDIRWPWQ
jgi:hypothetical protein